MEKLNNYYKDLPQGFTEVYCINAQKVSTGIIFTCVSLLLTAASFVLLFWLKFGFSFDYGEDLSSVCMALLMLCVLLIAYLIFHEITHGIFYKLFTRQKLKFGLTLTCAYCGLKEGFVNKKTAFFAVLAPLVIYSVVFILLIVFLPADVWNLMICILFSLHFGGCVGDIWVALILLCKFRKAEILVCDDGPCQRFFAQA